MPWLNSFLGTLEYKGQTFEQATYYQEYAARILGIVTLPVWADDMEVDVTELFKSQKTFDEGIADQTNNIIVRQRLRMAKKRLFVAVQAANLL